MVYLPQALQALESVYREILMARNLTPRDVQKIFEQHALDVWQQIPIDNFCMGIPVGDPDLCIVVQVPAGMKDRVPESVTLVTKDYGTIEIRLKAVEDYIPMELQVNTRICV